jgi:hypothetical protein
VGVGVANADSGLRLPRSLLSVLAFTFDVFVFMAVPWWRRGVDVMAA